MTPDNDNQPTTEAEPRPEPKRSGGVISWMARNSVAANIMMLILLVGGGLMMFRVKQEVFPEVDLGLVLINVPYPGASPEEVEKGVILVVEEAVRGIDGVKEVRSTAAENIGVVAVELMIDTNPDQALNDIKAAVDRIATFPEDIERPVVFMASNRVEVISLAIYGDQSESALRETAESLRDELLQDRRVTYIELAGVRPLEVSIEVPQNTLIEYGLTIDQVAAAVRGASVEVPAGGVKTEGGEVLLRTSERRDRGQDFASIALLSRPDGSTIRLGDIAEIKDGYSETDVGAYFDGKPAIMLKVFRSGSQTPLDISKAVYDIVKSRAGQLPPGIEIAPWFDSSEFYSSRLDLLKRNAIQGLILVFLCLALFLEIRLAFWVTLGIPISFLGAFLFLPAADVSINMISLFAFIQVLGMVVDDAIVVGESVYKKRQQGMGKFEAAIAGVKEVAVPVTFAIVTTIVAYLPMLFIPGVFGKFFRVIPIVVISTLVISLIEAIFILPAHLAHSRGADGSARGLFGMIDRIQQKFSHALEKFIHVLYAPAIRWSTRNRYATVALGLAALFAAVGYAGGRMQFTPMPKVDSDVIIAMASLPHGTSIERTKELTRALEETARDIMEEAGGEERIKRGLFSLVGAQGFALRDPGRGTVLSEGSHLTEVAVYMHEDRPIRAPEFAQRWREKLADFPGLDKMSFNFATGPAAGAAISLELSHRDRVVLEVAAEKLATKLAEFDGVHDLDDGFSLGKAQLNIKLTQEGRSLGLTEAALASQVRGSFFGSEAVRQQRGRDEVRVYVRLPRAERESLYNVEELLVRTPSGGWMPFEQAATVEPGRAFTSVSRVGGRRALTVTADVDESRGNARQILETLSTGTLPELMSEYPGLTWRVTGAEQDFNEANTKLFIGFGFAMIVIFALLAVVFKSYIQPLIVMSAIPFGFVGALIGHIILGYDLSLMSVMGVVALAGVVVNDSILLVTTVNEYRAEGMLLANAIEEAGIRRFRPILLTSLTTFLGLMPIILETSVQARFMIPMAVSLGFGVIFATGITLLLVPALYLAVDDVKRGASKTWRFFVPPMSKL